jgi:hypothetical protein
LVPLFAFDERGAIVGFVRFWTGVNGEAGAVGSCVGRDVAITNAVIFDEVCGEAGLTQVNGDVAIEAGPLKMSTEKPVDRTHKINCDELRKELFEPTFDCGVFRKINEVIHVKPNSQGRRWDVFGGIVGVAKAAGEHAGV